MTPSQFLEFLQPHLMDPQTGWSIGTHGVSAEFMWERNEVLQRHVAPRVCLVISGKGALYIHPRADITPVPYTSASDGSGRHSNLAFCLPTRTMAAKVVTSLGQDQEAIREQDRDSRLFNLGLGAGLVELCVRTADPDLIAALDCAEGKSLLSGDAPHAMPMILEKQPHRVMLSPLGRLEVYQGIPPPHGKSPEGPHTHVFPSIIAKGLLHPANVPIPEGFQSVLYMHSRPTA